MLGQLLHSFNPSRRVAPRSQDVGSQVEDAHTKGLLFPDVPSLRDVDNLYPTTPVSEPPDCHLQADLDLDASRDVRVLIAQGETLALQPLLLFDSKYDPSTEPPKVRHVRTGSRGDGTAHHSRTASGPPRQYGKLPQIASIPESSGRESPSLPSPTSAASTLQRSRFRRSSLPSAGDSETPPPRPHKETDEIVNTALNCMFENVQTTYRGISNKIKIVQREARPYDSTICRDNFGSQANLKGLGSTVRRPSTLSSSFTAGDTLPEAARQVHASEEALRAEGPRRTVLITRTFSVKWTDEDSIAAEEPSDIEKSVNDAPVPTVIIDYGENSASPPKPRRLPMKPTTKPPMFAITLVLSLPVSTGETSRPASRSGGSRRKGSEATGDWNSLASSFDSGLVLDPLFGIESSTASLSSDVDERVDKVIGQHWDIIVRTLSSLQQLAEEKILEQLRAATHRGRAPKLLNYALASELSIRKAALQACTRLVRGIRILRVRTGQGRWGVWRDEARWLNKWAAEREKATFLFNLCTAFLGTHTEWLDIAAPKHYRQQHREQLRLSSPNEPSVPNRTVIVSNDKMVARRLVFLLSGFLPSNCPTAGDASPGRPSTSASVRGYSQSPPHMPLSREESLRRTINRRGKRSGSRQAASGGRTPQPSSAPSDTDDKTETGTVRSLGDFGHARRESAEIRSLMRTKLTIVDIDPASRKSSATTSPTVNPGLAMPIAHIGLQRKYSSGQEGTRRPDSQDSLASENLMQTLQRSNTGTSFESQSAASRWGSLRSFWSMGSRRDSASNYSDATQNDDEGLGIIGLQHSDSHNKLSMMVNEAEAERSRARRITGTSSPTAIPATPEIRSPDMELPPNSSSSQPIDVPLKMTVNEQDGVIDVEFPGFSPVNSPPVVGYPSGSSYGSLSLPQHLMLNAPRDTGHAMNVAGWLRVGIHPDFELQATPPYADLVEDVKNAMRAEPTPVTRRTLPDGDTKEEWVDVCTSVIADAENFSIKRLRLRRLVQYVNAPPAPSPVTPMTLPRFGLKRLPIKSQYGNPYDDVSTAQIPTQVILEELFEEEKIAESDRALMDALDRVIATGSGPASRMPSAASSRANSVRGRSSYEDAREPLEIPHSECKRMVMGALEQIATAVERDRRDARKYGGARLRSLNDGAESSLRDGISKWFDNVEQGKKAIEAVKAASGAGVAEEPNSPAKSMKRAKAVAANGTAMA